VEFIAGDDLEPLNAFLGLARALLGLCQPSRPHPVRADRTQRITEPEPICQSTRLREQQVGIETAIGADRRGRAKCAQEGRVGLEPGHAQLAADLDRFNPEPASFVPPIAIPIAPGKPVQHSGQAPQASRQFGTSTNSPACGNSRMEEALGFA
jgi:hypothetical protein